MIRESWIWYILLSLFYIGLFIIGYSFYQEYRYIRILHTGDEVSNVYEGNDWVTWEDRDNGVFAKDVHPLLTYKQADELNDIKEGDRLYEIDFHPIYKADVANTIIASKDPGTVYIIHVERPNAIQIMEKHDSRVINGFRLAYSFNDNGLYWIVSVWILGLGIFLSMIVLAILVPLVRGNFKFHSVLLGLSISAFLFFLLQFSHNIYLIVDEGITNLDTELTIEKLFIFLYGILLFFYATSYFLFKSESDHILYAIPSIVVGIFLLSFQYYIIYDLQELKSYHDLIERYTIIFFFIHVVAGIILHIVANIREKSFRQLGGTVVMLAVSIFAAIYYWGDAHLPFLTNEDVLAAYYLFLFFPLINASFNQLRFGRVQVVITATVQYFVFFAITIALFLLIKQLSGYILTRNSFREELEFLALLVAVLLIRWIYLANENRLNQYFTTAQQENARNFKSFIAQIPRYTSSHGLRKDVVERLMNYFQAEDVHLWWKGDFPEHEDGNMVRYHKEHEAIYNNLSQKNTVWSKNKQIAPIRLHKELENLILKSAYTLISPITVDEENYALLMLGKKRKGVYNLTDLEMLSQLVQQTQLTLNIIQLNTREKELIQAKYEADLMALRSQINPHFLFNTLNSLTELVHESPERAEDAIEKLSYIFRYTTKESNKNLVPLTNEVQLCSTYLDLEKIRFGDRLETHIRVEENIKDVEIPAFVLQTLIENCIKHGISKIMHKGLVTIDAFREDNFLVCEVRDNGPGIDLSRIYKSTGLSNSIKRFENLYYQKNLLYFENTGNGTLVRFKVPLVNTPEYSHER